MLPDNSRYEGQWVKGIGSGPEDGVRQGKGKLTYPDGTVHEGIFHSNKLNGFGRRINTKGEVYKGYFANDQASGMGTYEFNSGSKYEGNWHSSLPSNGMFTYADGRVYDGDFINGLKDGQGELKWPAGAEQGLLSY